MNPVSPLAVTLFSNFTLPELFRLIPLPVNVPTTVMSPADPVPVVVNENNPADDFRICTALPDVRFA